ncbi:MAG TPA: hypothetical protein VLX92_30710, partial [Kofleriaceae bacterium]|nr:hypothetical protein [Kofleriaceae bacterium]
PPGASGWLDAATPVAVDAQLEPGDGAVLPPGLGHLDVDFAANDADDVHRVAITAPYLDLAIDAPGAPGPRHLELTPAEWAAVAATAPSATLSVASTHDGDATARVASATIALCDLPIGPLAFSGAPVDATGTLTAGPQLYRYDPAAAQTVPFVAAPAGGCIGCHESISADGTRIAAAGIDNGLFVGMIIDTQRQTIATISDDKAWTTAAFDPSGALVTAFEGGGQLALRDASGAMISAIATGEPADSPAISPDGSALAYVALPTPSDTMVGTALRVRPWSAASAQVGAPITLATAADAVSPTFSRDGAWIAYAITAGTESELAAATAIVRADGSAPPIAVSAGMGDGYLRWVSPFASARVGGAAPEPMAWLAMASHRTIGGRALAGSKQELWLVPFYPARGAVGRPVHLPGQPAELATLHTPLALAQ